MKVFKSVEVKPFQAPGGELVHQYSGRLEKHGQSLKHSLAKMSLAPGSTSEPHTHKVAEESFLVIRGHGVFKVDDEIINVSEGDCVFVHPGERHVVTNSGDCVFECVIATSPPWHPDDSF